MREGCVPLLCISFVDEIITLLHEMRSLSHLGIRRFVYVYKFSNGFLGDARLPLSLPTDVERLQLLRTIPRQRHIGTSLKTNGIISPSS